MAENVNRQKQVAAFVEKGWVKASLNRVPQGAQRVETTVRSLIEVRSSYHWQREQKRQDDLRKALLDMDDDERSQLLEIVFPRFATHAKRAWHLFEHLPFQMGYLRKPFRALGRAELLIHNRVHWLISIANHLPQYRFDIQELAAWAAHLSLYGAADNAGILLAGAIEGGGADGDAVLQILIDSANGTHEIGQMGRHVVRAMLAANRPEGWDFLEKLLLAAQRQEGLRQTILECADESHPQAFRRILRLIAENDLARFSATVRAVDVWFGFLWDAASVKEINSIIETAMCYLDDEESRDNAIKNGEAKNTFLGLWAIAFVDAHAAVRPAAKLLEDKDVGRRFVGAHMLSMLGISEAQHALIKAVGDEDLRVAQRAVSVFGQRYQSKSNGLEATELFERLEKLLERVPSKVTKFKPLVWPWVRSLSQSDVADNLGLYLGNRPADRLVAHLSRMSVEGRCRTIQQLKRLTTWDAPVRQAILAAVADPSSQVREAALQAVAEHKTRGIDRAETLRLEAMLSRKANDLRRGVLYLLLTLKDDEALSSSSRLLRGDMLQAAGGLELLRLMIDAERQTEQCRAQVRQFEEQRRGKLTAEQRPHVEAILNVKAKAATLDDCLGLIDPANRTRAAKPEPIESELITEATVRILKSLMSVIHQHRDAPVLTRWNNEVVLLGDIKYGFPWPKQNADIKDELPKLPLREVWEQWLVERPSELKDADGLELLRALHLAKEPKLRRSEATSLQIEWKYREVLDDILEWLLRMLPPRVSPKPLLDALQSMLAALPDEKLRAKVKDSNEDEYAFRKYTSAVETWLSCIRDHRQRCPENWKPEDHARLWRMLRFIDEPGVPMPRKRPQLDETHRAYEAGAANEADLYDQVLGQRDITRWRRRHFDDLWLLSALNKKSDCPDSPKLREVFARCRERILEVELGRGETPTAATHAALSLRHSGGMETLLRLLRALGRTNLSRIDSYYGESKSLAFSHLVRVTRPETKDTPVAFAKLVNEFEISQQRLLDAAVFAPQWAAHVEHALQWPGLVDAIWWVRAHTKDSGWSVDSEIKDAWKAEVSQRTPLTADDLLDGAVDVQWFQCAYAKLGAKRWPLLDEAAKYASTGAGHARARLFAQAMLGKVRKTELVKRIKDKRHQDSVRALGLLPLLRGHASEKDVLDRYRLMQEFTRESRKFGSQRQASEKRAASIGMENLARTAGYRDPIRLQWAMEAKSCADLSRGPVKAQAGDVTVLLQIDADGQPEISIERQGKSIKSIPPTVRKNAKVADLTARKTELKRQASRMRSSLETAMCRGDQFNGTELRELFSNPMLAPLLGRLVFAADGLLGYPVDGGRGLLNEVGTIEPLRANDLLKIAHPFDLFKSNRWDAWQRDCFAMERVQPFKQVFRELYVPTKTELHDRTKSRRYAGHQVEPRQALALLGARGWAVTPEVGVSKTIHDANISVWLEFQESFCTPADIEGLTLEAVRFRKRGTYDEISLVDVPARIFSEVMRDLDLVVSVAHRGGVDPEASASTVEMRAALLRETCQLLGLKNVKVQQSHALIAGELAEYRLHLGSAVTHVRPGGALFIVPVHSQHRGRLFLPFADDDPRTAEVMSKAILLAQDRLIKDPSILDQIRTGSAASSQ